MERVIVTRSVLGMVNMQVCAIANATDEEILAECNLKNPSGTSNGWTSVVRDVDGIYAPVRCQRFPDRMHFLVSC